MKKLAQSGTLALAVALAIPAFGFQKPQGSQGKSAKPGGVHFQGAGPHAGDWLRKNMNVPPAQQKQELEKDDQFKKLPPERQQQLLNRLNRFNNMTPDQKNRVLSHMQWLEHLPPEKKQEADELHQQFQTLSPERRKAVRRALYQMKDIPAEDRQKAIDSDRMKQEYSDQERQLMKGYTDLGFPDQHSPDDNANGPQEQEP